ncbi:hypothetical protein BHE74_00003539 [Ensete ventricosum]|nr:hypothetical protein BHE74_00003539 [Ensete ventricosum]
MRERGGKATVDERYTQWKSLIPVLYDWLANHNLVWPSLSCRYFPLLFLLPSFPPFSSGPWLGFFRVGARPRVSHVTS